MKSTWDTRIRRATELSSAYPFAAEGLRFYAQIAMLQQQLYSQIEAAPAQFFSLDGSSWNALNPSALPPKFSNFVRNLGKIAPAALAQRTDELLRKDSAFWLRLLDQYWHSAATTADEPDGSTRGAAEQHLAWLFLQPFAEFLAARHEQIQSDGNARRCPFCGGAPIVGVLRPEGDGAKKSLICTLCAHEWAFRRIYCPACGEERESHMGFYSASEIPHMRVDVCETCHTYMKSVDLTKMGLAVPVVDELAALPLDLWARQNGYHKLHINIVGA